jgi:transcriptional regulator with XRE-family HTH domain
VLKKDPSLKEFGERIREARKSKGLSQEALAFAAGIDRSYMGGVERGERNLSFKKMCHIADILGCDLGTLTKGLPTK